MDSNEFLSKSRRVRSPIKESNGRVKEETLDSTSSLSTAEMELEAKAEEFSNPSRSEMAKYNLI